jgi:hypothetical protein
MCLIKYSFLAYEEKAPDVKVVDQSFSIYSLFVSLVYCAESTVRWFVVREKHCWMATDSADKSKRKGAIVSPVN